MNWEEIKKQLKDEQVLIEVIQSDDNNELVEGKILYHHPNKKKVYQKMGDFYRNPNTTLTIEYTGKIPEDLAVMI